MSTSIIILETPFYTVSKTNEFAAFIELRSDTTDASPNKRPSNTEEIVQDGVVNYYGEPEPKMVTQWKKKLGSVLTKHVILPEMERRGIKCRLSYSWKVMLETHSLRSQGSSRVQLLARLSCWLQIVHP